MSHYRNASEVLPTDLLRAIQRHAAGMQLYIPRTAQRVGWGERSGARQALAARNEAIRHSAAAGASVDDLMAEYHLSYDSIRKILGGKNGSPRSGC